MPERGSVDYIYHRITTAPLMWRPVAEAVGEAARMDKLAGAGGALYGIWRSQIGRPRDELTAITCWPGGTVPPTASVRAMLSDGVHGIVDIISEIMAPTLRPKTAEAPVRQGNYAFRWFSTPEGDWPEFLDLCAAAWPGFESAYDSQVIGLWRMSGTPDPIFPDPGTGVGTAPGIRSLLLTRRPDLAMWERSKLPQGAAEAEVRRTLSRRYDLCSWTMVTTATLLTAQDHTDEARWT